VSAERPPDGEGDDRDLTSGDPLRGSDEPAAPPPPPWRRDPKPQPGAAAGPPEWLDAEAEPELPPPAPHDPPPEVPPPVESPWRPDPEDEEQPSHHPAAAMGPPDFAEDEPEVLADPAPPRTGSVGPPGFQGAGGGTIVPPRTPTPPRAPQPEGLGQRYVLAGWWSRVGAFIIDALVIGVVAAIVIILITAAAGGVGFLGGDATGYGGIVVGLLFSTLIATGVALLYAPVYMARTDGQTLGKQLMRIRVVRPKGQPVDFLWSVLREVVVKTLLFGGILSSFTFGLAWLLDCLWPLWDDENRALHDLVVDSRVVQA
jgi:uncharacterized RDD family membrane protein YckC